MVYVDSLKACVSSGNWPYSRSCHLFADSDRELVEFAGKIGLKPEWIQRTRLTHFDLSPGKRVMAVKLGAQQVDGAFLKTRLKTSITE